MQGTVLMGDYKCRKKANATRLNAYNNITIIPNSIDNNGEKKKKKAHFEMSAFS